MNIAIKYIVEYTGMDTVPVSSRQARKIGRYTVVRAVSRIGDYVITNGLIWLYGAAWFYPAIILGAVFNVVSDYTGQKMWVFTGRRQVRKATRKELFFYLLLRTIYALPALLALIILYKFLHLSFFISSFLVMVAMWFVSFKDFEALFTDKMARAGGMVHRLLSRSGITETH